jgi:hypothetical protein
MFIFPFELKLKHFVDVFESAVLRINFFIFLIEVPVTCVKTGIDCSRTAHFLMQHHKRVLQILQTPPNSPDVCFEVFYVVLLVGDQARHETDCLVLTALAYEWHESLYRLSLIVLVEGGVEGLLRSTMQYLEEGVQLLYITLHHLENRHCFPCANSLYYSRFCHYTNVIKEGERWRLCYGVADTPSNPTTKNQRFLRRGRRGTSSLGVPLLHKFNCIIIYNFSRTITQWEGHQVSSS